ncbi:MAG: excinuclease ABC subunit UvrC [Spirochaetes bacterium]|jgi:excinuclease ABC subunit C|nr:excinuclease ABC subunit UvrC [Spirochaetota bacterium]
MKNVHELITDKVKQLTTSPGVYLMKNHIGDIIYVGKARSLKSRVSSYFQNNIEDIKTRTLVNQITDFEVIATETEIEALLLEDTLIKKHRPRFNIRLKDDKRYPYIAVTFSEEYPRLIFTRNVTNKKNHYYGPYTDAQAARNTIKAANRIFRLKTCTRKLPLTENERPCLNYQIRQCSGICRNLISREEYLDLVRSAELFLKGKIEPVIEKLNDSMNRYSSQTRFEKAAEIRDIIFDIQKISERQNILMPQNHDADYIAMDVFKDEAILLLFEFRKGVLTGRKIRLYENSSFSTNSSILRTFILNHYSLNEIPHCIITQEKVPEHSILEEHFTKSAGHTVKISAPRSSHDKGAMSMVRKNIDLIIAEKMAQDYYSDKNKYLINLKNILSLPTVPIHMVCFDISNLQGKNAVASMVSFKNAQPDKAGYRHFTIRGYTEANDPGMIHEAVARFIQNIVNNGWEEPDLIVIDGGPTQLARAIEARDAFGLETPVISIAKQHEELFLDPGEPSIRLSHDSQELKIIQRLRDATHDFGIAHHRKLRTKATVKSELDSIPGIGPKKRSALLKHFKSVENIRRSDEKDIAAVESIAQKDAATIYNYFNRRDRL